jgi:hypothetical protein
VTYAAKIDKAEALLDWAEPAAVLARKIRAFNPFPGATLPLAGLPFKVWRAAAVAGSGRPGEVLALATGEAKNTATAGVTIATGEGALHITELQKPGGRRLDAADAARLVAELRALGVMLTIDDFGEGYSALNYLRRLPIHGLKLSQLFVEGVPHNQSDGAVCQAVIGIARSLGLGLVAEGVESEAQRQFLLRLGVPVGQGFLFAPGLPADEFARTLAAPEIEHA